MGYDSSIEVKKEEIEKVEQVLKKIGFELAASKPNRFQLFSYRKYIDDNCKYKKELYLVLAKQKINIIFGEETGLDVQEMIYHYIMKQLYIYQNILIETT